MRGINSKLQHNYSKIYRIVIVAITIGLMVFVSPKTTKFQYEFEQGFPWVHQPLYAPFAFGINKTKSQIAQENEEIVANSYLYFDVQHSIDDSVVSAFKNKSSELFVNDSIAALKYQDKFEKRGIELITRLYQKGIIATADSLINKPADYVIKTIEEHTESQYEIQRFLTINQAFDSIQLWTQNIKNGKILQIAVFENLSPNITYNPELTEEIKLQKLDALTTVYGKVNVGEEIVAKGEIITPEIFQKLNSLQEKFEKQVGANRSEMYVYGGTFIIVAFATLILIVMIKTFNPFVYSETNSFTLILILFFLNYLMANIPRFFPEVDIYILPFALFAVILQSFFRSSLAAIIYLIMIMVATIFAPNAMEFLWIEAPVGLLAILLLKDLRKRSQLLGVIGAVFAASSLLYFAFSIIKEGHFSNIDSTHFLWFSASALLTIAAIPLVFIIERTFGLISEMALLELADTNNTLLRELAQKAPGTFQHSMQVANLAEECALEIGGDPLLIRTGALYHDIGKMKNPQYFIENQAGGHNPHNDLSNHESAKIIINHVLDGIEMAKRHKIPEKIIDFIRTHHGTTTTRYFYLNAKKLDDSISIEDFQYPGPLPFSKETAILMLCDGVEAAARSLPVYTAESINKLIDGIFNTILSSQQLDYSPITFQNISALKKLLQKKIMNIYHVRVAYPSA
ncbi:MAG: putative nucleotidyltransferase with HDIG domain [Salibacteraceae bacterium]|jgi:putative nucleotidyltransferase with HDIG domain